MLESRPGMCIIYLCGSTHLRRAWDARRISTVSLSHSLQETRGLSLTIGESCSHLTTLLYFICSPKVQLQMAHWRVQMNCYSSLVKSCSWCAHSLRTSGHGVWDMCARWHYSIILLIRKTIACFELCAHYLMCASSLSVENNKCRFIWAHVVCTPSELRNRLCFAGGWGGITISWWR